MYLAVTDEEIKNLKLQDQEMKGTAKFKYFGFTRSRDASTEENIKS